METLLNVEDEVQLALNELEIFDKLERMEDFMNQNDLKVSITNENAVTTGLVTYTCTVKDQDNNALKNKVVEWYKGTTLLGMDATDSNGVSTFSHRVTEADIYDVHAVVRGTHAGDDIRMFVKDKTNVASFNIWSAGEYNNISPSSNGELTNEWSTIGNNSVKLTNDNGGAWVYCDLTQTYSDSPNKMRVTADILSNAAGRLYCIIDYSDNTQLNTEYVVFPASESMQTCYVEVDVDSDKTISKIRCRFTLTADGVGYIDNVRFNES